MARSRAGSSQRRRGWLRQKVELRGHLLDSLILSEALDEILAAGGDYALEELEVGHASTSPSNARLTVAAPDSSTLEGILNRLRQLGGEVAEG